MLKKKVQKNKVQQNKVLNPYIPYFRVSEAKPSSDLSHFSSSAPQYDRPHVGIDAASGRKIHGFQSVIRCLREISRAAMVTDLCVFGRTEVICGFVELSE